MSSRTCCQCQCQWVPVLPVRPLPAAFWVVALALADPEVKERLTREIQDVLGAAACATTGIVGCVLLMLFSLMHRSHSISFTRAQGMYP